ncbi:transcription factor HES-1-B-like [Brachionichthys hirsutus]|uniref:transcription factor HES-1-B-like n=1 Tax=Brachionichthys hirsutus TaxID=412623 RepID=UPI003604B17D
MPAGTSDRTSPPAAASTPSEKPRSLSETRKSSKPIMEKRRRARINESLGHLKTLIMDALKKDSSRHSKLEKADILEMTVKHLRSLQRLQTTAAVNADPSILGKYRAGFGECVGEVTRFLSTCEGVTADVRARLLSHLAACATRINSFAPQMAPLGLPQAGTRIPAAPQMPCESAAAAMHASSPDAMTLYGGFQVMPTADGQFAFLVPSAALLPPTVQTGHPTSPAAPPVTSDSVWRPW